MWGPWMGGMWGFWWIFPVIGLLLCLFFLRVCHDPHDEWRPFHVHGAASSQR